MASLRVVVTACVAVMTVGLVSAAGPEPDAGEIAVSLNETVLIELAAQADGTLKPVLLKSASGERPHILLRLSGDGAMRMLEVENHYDRTLKYTARMCMKKRGLCAKTSVLAVQAGLSAFESWGDPIDLLILSRFSFE
jgi:hypothetical protein